MKIFSLRCLALAVLLATNSCHAADDYDAYVRLLAAPNPADAWRAERELDKGGVKSFPALLTHLDDRNLIQPALNLQDRGTPTVGEFCFDTLQTWIEGNWPKGYRTFYVLTPKNIKGWLKTHADLSLSEMQLITRRESLHRAELRMAEYPADDYGAVNFLRGEVSKLERANQTNGSR